MVISCRGNLPMSMVRRVIWSSYLVNYIVIIRKGVERGIVVLPHEIIPRSQNIEVEPPIYVMMMHLTYAEWTLIDCSESKPGLECPVHVESPFRYVSVPACLHLRL